MATNFTFPVANCRTATKGVEVKVELNDEAIQNCAHTMAISLTSLNTTVTNILTLKQVEECFAYSIKLMIHACSRTLDEGRKCNDPIPLFLCDLVKSLQMVERGVRVTTPTIDPPKRPDSYTDFLAVCESIGLPTGKVLYPRSTDKSTVLAYDVREMEGTPSLFGVKNGPDIDEMIVRYLISVVDAERDKLLRILGHSDLYYCSGDELVRQWAVSSVGKVK